MNAKRQPDPVEGMKISQYKGEVLRLEVNNSQLSEDAEQVILSHKMFKSTILEHLSQDLFLPRLSVNGDVLHPATGSTISYICFTLFN